MIDSNDKSSLAKAFSGALKTVEALEQRSVVCNLLGADMYVYLLFRLYLILSDSHTTLIWSSGCEVLDFLPKLKVYNENHLSVSGN